MWKNVMDWTEEGNLSHPWVLSWLSHTLKEYRDETNSHETWNYNFCHIHDILSHLWQFQVSWLLVLFLHSLCECGSWEWDWIMISVISVTEIGLWFLSFLWQIIFFCKKKWDNKKKLNQNLEFKKKRMSWMWQISYIVFSMVSVTSMTV